MAINLPKRAGAYIREYDINLPSKDEQLNDCREKANALGYTILKEQANERRVSPCHYYIPV